MEHSQIRNKALQVNLRPDCYGSFAEIGAGQEVVRWFFQAGGAAGTVSKSISAYDMKVSDSLYGDCARYVCKDRLMSMLDAEQSQNEQILSAERGHRSCFFTFADTVSAINYQKTNECHGWMGIRFQAEPGAGDSTIAIHVRMLDRENGDQQEALGVVGVNLVYGAFFLRDTPDKLVESLLDGLNTNRIEIDVVEFSGQLFQSIDNRVMSLQLVRLGLTGAAMFDAAGSVLQPSEVLRKRPLLIERGRFRPFTNVNLDMLTAGLREFETVADVAPSETLPIMEITMSNLARSSEGEVCLEDFVSRAEVLETTGYTVMISNFFEYYRLASYLFRLTDRPIGIALGVTALQNLFDEQYYEELDGGILESFGRLFKEQLKLLVYPWRDIESGQTLSAHNMSVQPELAQLLEFLKSRKSILSIEDINHDFLSIHSEDVLRQIAAGDQAWTSMVPPSVAEAIQRRRLFGFRDFGESNVA